MKNEIALPEPSPTANPEARESAKTSEGAGALDQYIGRVKRLPAAPLVVTQLLSLFGEPDRDVDRIVELISLDPSLTAEILKRCNSAYFSLARPVRDMFEAVFQLGFYEVYCIVIALFGARATAMVQTAGSLDAEKAWQHSVATAAAAATLAKRIQATEATAFTAGLLHDIGKLVFASVEGVGYAKLIHDAAASGVALAIVEEGRFGFNHTNLGGHLLARWNLPDNVCVAVRRHHSFSDTDEEADRLAAVVYVGNLLAHEVLEETGKSTDLSSYSVEALAQLALKPTDIPTVLEETRSALQEVEALFHIGG